MTVEIRAAHPDDAQRLTEIAHAAKRHWGYDDELIELWREDLTVTPDFIASHPVFCAMKHSEIIGFYALTIDGDSFDLEHMWVDPAQIRTGVGRLLIEHAISAVRELGGSELRIASDPNAVEFYLRMGAERIGNVASKPAERTLPFLRLSTR